MDTTSYTGLPNKLCQGLTSVKATLTTGHMLEKSETTHIDSRDKFNHHMARSVLGIQAPLKLQTELQIASKMGRLPCLPSSRLMLDVLRGTNEDISFDDILNNPREFGELQVDPHLAMDRHDHRPPRSKTARSGADDSASIDDGVSTCSNISDLTSIYDDSEVGFPTSNDTILSTDVLDEKLDIAIEGLRNKDLRTRENSLRTLQTLFSQKYVSELVINRSESLTDQLILCLRKGNESEGNLAAIVTSLFFIQLGEPNDELFLQFRDIILPILRDESKSSSIRKNYAQAIGIICFIACEDISSTVELMKTLETIFSRSYLLPDRTTPIINHDLQELHTSALSSWCLLMSTMPNNLAHELIRTYAPEKIPGLIESNDGDLRNQAGETIAVLYEIARDINSIFAEPPESLLITLEKKANESAKYRGKKEKRLQRATFREIYNSFEEGTSPEFDIKFGRETLEITSWTTRLYYNIFSSLLATGMNIHLKENGFLRSVFNLDDLEIEDTHQSKTNRFERQLANRAAFKVRTQALKKTRANKVTRIQNED
ncbi:unnamed protein product [Adineta steineri]|uniref:Interferon-related developmental regulator 1-like protein n=1 Tax=Adineta steineri TaxID=433720 RepID=A0A815HZQ0_9BILA|nr:unnamed protein product [Adineta steineri]CAF1599719.1 unnamed protein product [Adineta steineri]